VTLFDWIQVAVDVVLVIGLAGHGHLIAWRPWRRW